MRIGLNLQSEWSRLSPPSSGQPWAVVVGSALALMVCNGPMILFPFGVLVGPITAEFGWPRATLASAVLAAHITGGLAIPFVGVLIDRFGVRTIALPAICLFALGLAGISTLPAVPIFFVIAYALLGLMGAGHSTLIYARAVSTWFDEKRGLALGISLSGVGIGVAVVPEVARILIANYGWRAAYIGLGVLVLVVAGPAVAFLVHDRLHEAAPTIPSSKDDADGGTTLSRAVKSYQFWALAVVVFLVAIAVNGMLAHVAPLLNERGISAQSATHALSAAGLALIAGRAATGYFLDRLFAPFVSAAFFLIPLCGIALLGFTGDQTMALFAAILLGIGIGAEVDIIAFLLGRYFGLSHYGAVYGTLLAIFTLGSGAGPWLIALSFDRSHAYANALMGCASALIAASVLVASLGPYRYAGAKS
jgi:predicted MFS family arabinose efflux permease